MAAARETPDWELLDTPNRGGHPAKLLLDGMKALRALQSNTAFSGPPDPLTQPEQIAQCSGSNPSEGVRERRNSTTA